MHASQTVSALSVCSLLLSVAVVRVSCNTETGPRLGKLAIASAEDCKLTDVGFVCVCSSTAQDCSLKPVDWPTEAGSSIIVTTNRNGDMFKVHKLDSAHFGGGVQIGDVDDIRINLGQQKQPILGWGGAITDSAALNILSLSRDMSNKLLESYFGETGLRYNMARTSIAGADFSTRAYSYDDTDEPDYELKHWSLQPEDTKYKIPVIKRALELVGGRKEELKLIASPWSPPKWMKDNKSFVKGHLIDDDKTYESYANYLKQFFVAYKQHNISFWGATIQNEPQAAYLADYSISSLQMTPSEAAKFLTKFYGPALESIGLTKNNFKLLVGDDNLGFVDGFVTKMLNDAQVRRYASGFAIHWYNSGTLVPYDRLNELYADVENATEFVLMTEACNGKQQNVSPGSWDYAAKYAADIVKDVNRHVGGWLDWNVALDERGGPNWANVLTDSPIVVDAKNNLFYKQPMYYALGHFSRFFTPNSTVLSSQLARPTSSSLEVAAVHKTDTGHLVVNLLNPNLYKRSAKLAIEPTHVSVPTISLELDALSINTIIVKL